MHYAVGQVAGFAGTTVRTLHHYDEIGLLRPGARTGAGHRRYDDADLDRLQRILFYRELGFPLDEIATLLDDPGSDPVELLRRRHEVLTGRVEALRAMAAAVERAMEARTMGVNLTPEEKFEVFGDHDPDRYAEEVGRRWGTTDAYRESQRRTAGRGKQEWLRIKDEQRAWADRLAAVMDTGAPPGGEAATDLAEEHRAQICRYYYTCTYEIHTGLARLYTTDPRFTAHYEAIRPGMAAYLAEAITANAARRGEQPGE
ncbi:MerR family transcriptional regulator [Streptomyces sp. SL13]|jgi:DNA-binding transcriptional MerR regulator|uniref:MerR family transcriptional regulator n=1 Tax=Streptantibioticus silvisoli TaxID=2705255 RepID=A0AA90H0A0_9ACTN|nr:MerR family transcriptional regulator [Streptantibioticus silvisoli]MDI5962896.1 MerR family transcriptional regulator [Streptantibioticus silvisoli]MDI5969726.1 MerR family transcriptional regulator [Streptantibioticus silvisoli]